MSQFSRAGVGAMLAAMLLLTACQNKPAAPAASLPAAASSSASEPAASQGDGAAQSTQPDESIQPDESVQPAPDQSQEAQPSSGTQEVEQPQEPAPQPYDFSQSVPESEPVDNSYFEDAAFVGDSRTDGFMIYSGIGCGENLTSNGLSIFKLSDASQKVLKIDGQKYSLKEALDRKQYGKVYLSLGTNELGFYDDEGFYKAYLNAIDVIREAQPNAVIYIQGLIPLNEEAIKAKNGPSYLTNAHMQIYNELMKKAAEEKQVVYLDLNPYFADENGSLPADASKDGVHLKSDYCKKWLEYLKVHTVDFETLYPNEEGSL